MIIVPVALDGKRFDSYNVRAGFAAGDQAGPSRNPVAIPRAGESPIPVGMSVDVRRLPIAFNVEHGNDVAHDTGHVLMTLLAMLQPGKSAERTLVVELADGPNIGTQLEGRVTVGQYSYDFRNNLVVDFFAADERWYERTDTILSPLTFSLPVSIPMLNHGGASVAPMIAIGYSAQRITENATVGWKWRRSKIISNGGDRNWNRVRLTLDLGDTAAWVTAGDALASGNDVRIRCEGRELYRTLTNWNTGRTFVHFIGTIPAGGSATYEVVYGNPDATAPRTLSTRGGNYDTYVADDLQGDSGVLNSGGTLTSADNTKSWEVNQWRDGFIGFLTGTGSVRYRRILSNTPTDITVNRALATSTANGTTYVLWKSGVFMDGGRATAKSATSITDDQHSIKWAPDSLRGATVTFIAGSGASPSTMTVASNTDETITFTTAFTVQPAVNDQYEIQRYGVLNYMTQYDIVSTQHRGLWRTSKYSSKGGRTRFGDQTPGGWIPWLMVDNQDQFAQLDVTDETAGPSVSNWPFLSARRRVRSDLPMPQKGTADGVCLYEPRGLVSFDWTYRMENDHGIGAVVIMTQEPDGDNWETIASDTTTRASLTSVSSGDASGGWSLIGDTDPVRVYTGIIPADGVDAEIASTESKNRNSEVRSYTRTIVYLSLDDCGGLSESIWSAGGKVAIYDLNVTGRIGGGNIEPAAPPYDAFAIGGDGHHLHIESDERLFINPAPSAEFPLFGIYDVDDVLLKRVPWAGLLEHHEKNLDGTDTAVVGYTLALSPGSNMITGEDNITGWTLTPGTGVTAAISNEPAITFDGGATSLKVNITATPAGSWSLTLTRPFISVIPGTLYEYGYAARSDGSIADTFAQMNIDTFSEGAIPSTVDLNTITATDELTADWQTRGNGFTVFAGSATDAPTSEVTLKMTIFGTTGSVTGAVYLDSITYGVPNLYLDESEMGTLTADIIWNEAHYA